MKPLEFLVLGQFDVHDRTSLGFWQVSTYDESIVQQLLDCHDFLLDCEVMELCVYTGTSLYIFCQELMKFMEDNYLSPKDLEYYEQPILGIESIDFNQVICDEIDYVVPLYCDPLVSNDNMFFGPNPNGGCLGFWSDEEVI